jgi:lipopolysaccharide/colanic/teichoic acid biosynthesis glycosyltransferase/glycosyltransferase involved in cell wall biosynthesis
MTQLITDYEPSITADQSGREVSFACWNYSPIKRAFDLVCASILLLVSSPLMLVLAVLVKFTSSGPVLFRQTRVGKLGREFKLLKFRSMRHARQQAGPGITAEGDSRVTGVGRFLRKSKFDELPQLINVICGHMSLVGPRPDLPEFMAGLIGEQKQILELRPGISGAASLRFRNEEKLLKQAPPGQLTAFYVKQVLPEKVRIDMEYAERASLFGDLGILFRTAGSAVFGAESSTGETPAVEASAKQHFDVVMVTTVHPALDIRIFHREAKTLAAAGFRVCIVGRHEKCENVEGVWIEGMPTPQSRWQRLLLGRTAFQRGLKLGGSLFIFHDPELFWMAILVSLFGKKVVYDCHENLPAQVLQKVWIPRFMRRVLVPVVWFAEWLASRCIAGVVLAREAIQSRFPKRRTVVVRNYPTANVLQQMAEGEPLETRDDLVVYAGALSRVRGINELVRAFDGSELSDAKLVLVGEFEDPEFRSEILASLPSNVEWVGQKPYREVLQYYRSAKIGALLLYPTPSHRHSLPVKLFEYLGAGLIVVASDLPEFRELLEGCGEQVDPTNVDQIRSAIRRLLSQAPSDLAIMSKVARDRVMTSYTWEAEGQRLASFCSKLLPARSRKLA